jgi:hypothetical protein
VHDLRLLRSEEAADLSLSLDTARTCVRRFHGDRQVHHVAERRSSAPGARDSLEVR